jgi:uncharacterized protein (TIGR02145 family)
MAIFLCNNIVFHIFNKTKLIMKKLFLLLAIFISLKASGQNITFTGNGLSTVKIENLTKDASIIVNAGEVLTLSVTTGIDNADNNPSGLKIFPNPMIDKSTLEISAPASGDASVTIFDMSGKIVTQIKTYLDNSQQKFNLSGLQNGIYLINVKGYTYQFSGKLVCTGKSTGTIKIEKISREIQSVSHKTVITDSKGALETPSLGYSPGDKLMFTGTSGNNITIVTTKAITQDTTITFSFMACTDGDGNNYPVVQIGTQVWMAANLKTTKYSDVTDIPLITGQAAWAALTTPGYCWYGNDQAMYGDIYGALYNWYSLSTTTNGSKNVCPAGWQVPTDAQWTILTNYLGGQTGASVKLKETGTTHWSSPNTATNETGFTALPGGTRAVNGSFNYIGLYGYGWSATEYSTSDAWIRGYSGTTVVRTYDYKKTGTTVRCLRDILIETEAAIKDSLTLCYTKLYDYMELAYLFDAVYSNYITAPNSSWTEIYQHTQTFASDNAKIRMLWSKAYEIIYKINFIIKSSEIVISDPFTRIEIIAQAKAIRSYLYYNLMTWFGEIPIETGISLSLIPRNSIEQVLQKIKLDASEASQYLPTSWPISDRFRITQSFAKGLLSRASLYSKNYTEAITPTQQIINSGMFALSADTNNFTTSNTEIIWGFAKRTNTEFNTFFDKGSYVPVIRYTESYLISAEALFNTGNTASALSYINALNARRGKPNLTSLTSDNIFQHWNTQLVKEGSMFITLKRFDRALSVVQNFPHKLLLPVPLYYLNINPYTTQNIGY